MVLDAREHEGTGPAGATGRPPGTGGHGRLPMTFDPYHLEFRTS